MIIKTYLPFLVVGDVVDLPDERLDTFIFHDGLHRHPHDTLDVKTTPLDLCKYIY